MSFHHDSKAGQTVNAEVLQPETIENYVSEETNKPNVVAGQARTGYEHLTVFQTVMKFKFASLMCFCASFSAAAEGYQISLVGNIVANAGFVKQFGTEVNADGSVALASSVLSLWGTIGSVFQLVGQFFISFVSNRFGRKKAMYTLWLSLAISITCECVARDWRVWLVAKVFGSFGVGCLQATVPVYVGEIAPIRARGFFLMCYSFWWITGQFFAPVALQSMSSTNPENWLTLVYTQWGHVGIMLVIFVLIPESPAWYILRGESKMAKKAIKKLFWGVEDVDIELQYSILANSVHHEREISRQQKSENWYDIFRGTDRLRTIISFWTILTQQVIGLQIFFTYGTYFFQQAGVEDPFMVTCITSGINIATSVVIIAVADYTGRRWMAISGSCLCWICNVGVGILGVTKQTGASDILLVVFAVFWNIGLIINNASGYAYLGETSSQRLRAYTGGFAIGIVGPVGIIMQFLVPYMLNANQWNWGLKTTWFFAGIGFPFVAAMFFLLPETNKRSTPELDELFERKIKPWRFSKTETMTERAIAASEETEKTT